MGAIVYLAAGYTVFWVVTFAFIYSMVQRQRSLQQEIEQLEQLTQAGDKTGDL